MRKPNTALIFAGIWVLVFILSFILPRFLEPTGDGFTRGLNRLGAMFIWQTVALCIAVVTAVLAKTKLSERTLLRRLCYGPVLVHVLLVFFVIGVIVFLNFKKPEPQPYVPPPATAPVALSSPAVDSVQANEPRIIQTYMGIYRSGFEMSHFYTMDGEGPWWLEAKDNDWETLQSYFVEGPGRSGGVTVALTVSA